MKIKRKATAVAGADEKVKVSSNDTIADFLKSKLVAGTDIVLTEQNDGGNETLEIKSTATATALPDFVIANDSSLVFSIDAGFVLL